MDILIGKQAFPIGGACPPRVIRGVRIVLRVDDVRRPKRPRHCRETRATVASMKLRPALLELVVFDMAATLAFYRRLGLEVPAEADHQPHVDVELGDGMRLAWDTEETIRSFDPGWSPPSGGGHRVAL